ncbi:uncharacterized protein LOC130949008 [Arachis stenosperma]|uniref:uncharacterized protein LOC130949008 n=1 Tax=Arachis stenosperma TaxID=217475 RepID=UPI0025AB9562|nr:uncharacterized protein LOC130949008 [Arachis stenosperma]
MQGSSSSYQKPLANYANDGGCEFYKLIHSKQNMAILSADANLSESVIETVVQETINELQSKILIKKEFQLPEEIIPADSSSSEGKKEEKAWPPPASAVSYNLTLKTREVYDLIKRRKTKGIKIEDMIREINLSETVVRELLRFF